MKRINPRFIVFFTLGVTIFGCSCTSMPSSSASSTFLDSSSNESSESFSSEEKAEENYSIVDGSDDAIYIMDNNDIAVVWESPLSITQVQANDVELSPDYYECKDGTIHLKTAYLSTISKGQRIKLTISSENVDYIYDLVRPTAVIDNLNEINDANGYYILDGDIDAYAVNDDTYTRFNWCKFLTLSDGTYYSWYERSGNDGEKTIYRNEGFNGVLDGRGYTIRNITNVSYGLFAIVGKDGVIKNVHFEDFKGEDGWEQPLIAAQFYGTLQNVSCYSSNKTWSIIGIAGAGARFINVVAYVSSANVASLYTQVNLRDNTTFKNVYVVSNQSLGKVCFDETIDGQDIHTFNSEMYKYKMDPEFRSIDFTGLFDCSLNGHWTIHGETGLPFVSP